MKAILAVASVHAGHHFQVRTTSLSVLSRGERERQRERGRGREGERETWRQRDRERHGDRETARQRETETEKHAPPCSVGNAHLFLTAVPNEVVRTIHLPVPIVVPSSLRMPDACHHISKRKAFLDLADSRPYSNASVTKRRLAHLESFVESLGAILGHRLAVNSKRIATVGFR